MNLPELIDRCAEITASKGFDVSQHRTQLCLIATEIAEALECVTPAVSFETDFFSEILRVHAQKYEYYREGPYTLPKKHTDKSKVYPDLGVPLLIELADVLIRICSYVGGNGWRDEFMKSLAEKIEKNATRPYKHGKGF